MSQRQIDAAHRRSLKTNYKLLTTQEKRLVKIREKERELERSIKSQWNSVHFRQPPPYDPDNTPEDILDMIDLILRWMEEAKKLRQSADRLIEKYGLDEDEIANVHMQTNLSPGGSY